jgi:hypothetical protein
MRSAKRWESDQVTLSSTQSDPRRSAGSKSHEHDPMHRAQEWEVTGNRSVKSPTEILKDLLGDTFPKTTI